MGRKALELTNQRFGKLIVIKRMGNNKWGGSCWLCKCDCGNITEVRVNHLTSGHTKSCRCIKIETFKKTHGYYIYGTPKIYETWHSMIQRCNNKNSMSYKWYGARGIKVCERWKDFNNFFEDMGKKPDGLTIERKDNDGNYEPDICKWATQKENNRNNRGTKLNPLKVKIIKKLLKESYLTQTNIGDIFGVHNTTISKINLGKCWCDINY